MILIQELFWWTEPEGGSKRTSPQRPVVVSALGKGGVGSKLFATDGSSTGLESHPLWLRVPEIYIRLSESRRRQRRRRRDPP